MIDTSGCVDVDHIDNILILRFNLLIAGSALERSTHRSTTTVPTDLITLNDAYCG